jgi:hypothetical protein
VIEYVFWEHIACEQSQENTANNTKRNIKSRFVIVFIHKYPPLFLKRYYMKFIVILLSLAFNNCDVMSGFKFSATLANVTLSMDESVNMLDKLTSD